MFLATKKNHEEEKSAIHLLFHRETIHHLLRKNRQNEKCMVSNCQFFNYPKKCSLNGTPPELVASVSLYLQVQDNNLHQMLRKSSVFSFLPAPLRRILQIPFPQSAQAISVESNLVNLKTQLVFLKAIKTQHDTQQLKSILLRSKI